MTKPQWSLMIDILNVQLNTGLIASMYIRAHVYNINLSRIYFALHDRAPNLGQYVIGFHVSYVCCTCCILMRHSRHFVHTDLSQLMRAWTTTALDNKTSFAEGRAQLLNWCTDCYGKKKKTGLNWEIVHHKYLAGREGLKLSLGQSTAIYV